ncbi:MAG: HTH-type transcriptional regulator DegA [Lentisphaerae bacterium ADurb.Bin242]|nr:MAG: HTH-type transcriptional regulator DegA [Lentisphaerae bacterium ADurb.Bin242]
MVTIYDIAEKAKLSHTTVSMALRNKSSVKETTRKRVQTLAKRMGYRPNQIALSLKKGCYKRIAFLTTDYSGFTEMITRFGGFCSDAGYEMVLMYLSSDPVKARRTFEHLLQAGFAGIASFLYLYGNVKDLLLDFTSMKRPVALFGPPPDFVPTPGILPINVSSLRAVSEVTRKLVKLGHRRIVQTVPKQTVDLGWYRQKDELIRGILASAGVTDWNPSLPYDSDYPSKPMEAGYAVSRLLFREKPGTTACFCMNDWFAYGLMRGLKEQGIGVPEDFSLIGFGNTDMGIYSQPSLSSVELCFTQFADIGWDFIFRQLSEPDFEKPPKEILLNARFVSRESIGPAPRGSSPGPDTVSSKRRK